MSLKKTFLENLRLGSISLKAISQAFAAFAASRPVMIDVHAQVTVAARAQHGPARVRRQQTRQRGSSPRGRVRQARRGFDALSLTASPRPLTASRPGSPSRLMAERPFLARSTSCAARASRNSRSHTQAQAGSIGAPNSKRNFVRGSLRASSGESRPVRDCHRASEK